MKLNTTIKTLCAAVAFATSAAASAMPFYIDLGYSFESGGVNSTSTGWLNQLIFNYYSETQLDGSGGFSTSIGWNPKTEEVLASNQVGSFDPNANTNGYGDNTVTVPGFGTFQYGWLLSFSGTISGTVSGLGLDGLPVLTYTGGTIDMFLINPVNNVYINFMDLIVTGGQTATGVTNIKGLVAFSPVDAAKDLDFGGVTGSSTYEDLFHALSVPYCSSGSSSFADIVSGCGENAPVMFSGHFDTNAPQFDEDTGLLSGNHVGGIRFDVPEPASLALFGMGLLGLGAIRRRKSV